MKTYLYTAGAFAAALAMSGLPVVALAQDATDTTANTNPIAPTAVGTAAPMRVSDEARAAMEKAQLEITAARRAFLASTTAQMREAVQTKVEETQSLMQERRAALASTTGEQQREQVKQQAEQMREGVKQQFEQAREMLKNRIELMHEGTTTPAGSLEQLKQMIETRRMEIQGEAASTTPDIRKILEDAAPMRVAVHALLASQNLLGGGIGTQVSDIARKVDDSVATTTNAEAQIQSRGFFSKLLFGGDKKAAGVISDQVAQNQENIQKLAGLLSDASTTADVKAELETQIQAIQTEQARLQSVAQTQSKLWGIFSWRLF